MQGRFKVLAAKAQEAGSRIAAQVKEQQQKLAQKPAQPGEEGYDGVDMSSEMENALRLVQIQNKALRDRLRSAAEENERLKDQLQQGEHQAQPPQLPDAPQASSETRNGTTPLAEITDVTAEENTRLREHVQELAELLRQSEQRVADDNATQTRLRSLQDEASAAAEARATAESDAKEAQTALQAMQVTLAGLQQAHAALESELSQNAAGMQGLRHENTALQEALERAQEGQAAAAEIEARAADSISEIESLRQTVGALEAKLCEVPEPVAPAVSNTTDEDMRVLREELEGLKTQLQASLSQHQAEMKEMEESLKSTKAAHAQQLDQAAQDAANKQSEIERLQREKDSSEEALRAEMQANVETAVAAMRQEVEAKAAGETAVHIDAAVKAAGEAAKSETEALSRQIEELQEQNTLLSSEQAQSEEEARSGVVALLEAQQKVDSINETRSQAQQNVVDASSQAQAQEYVAEITNLGAKIEQLEEQLATTSNELRAAQIERDEALKSQAEKSAELARVHMEHSLEIEALEERTTALKIQLADAQAEATAKLEAAKEESGWLKEGAEELQRQLEAAGIAAQEAAQHAEASNADLQAQLRLSAAAAAESSKAQDLEKQVAELKASRAENETMRRELEAAQAEAVAMADRFNALEREHAVALAAAANAAREAAETAARNEAAIAIPSSPPPPAYDIIMQADIEAARNEAAGAAERALASDAARQDAEEELERLRALHIEGTTRLRAELDAALQEATAASETAAAATAASAAAATASMPVPLAAPLTRRPSSPLPSLHPSPRATSSALISSPDRAFSGESMHSTHSMGTASSTSPRGIIGNSLGASPLVPHHRRDPSYSSEIEPAASDGVALVASSPPVAGAVGGGDVDSKEGIISSPAAATAAGAAAVYPPQEETNLSVSALKERVLALERELKDSEHTHALRDTATAVLKEEIAELRRHEKRAAVDVDYVKAVLVESFASGELDPGSGMLPVLGRLLLFSPDDLERAAKGRHPESGVTATATALFARLTGAST